MANSSLPSTFSTLAFCKGGIQLMNKVMVFLSNKNVTVMLSWLIILKQLAATVIQ